MRFDSPSGLLASACAVHAVLIGGAYLSLPPFFDAMAADEGFSLEALQRAWALVPLGSGLSAFASGRWLKTHADRGLLSIAGFSAVAAVFLRGAASSEFVLSAAQLVYGLGTGGVLVALMSRVTRSFEGETAGRAQAAYYSAYTIGAAVGVATAEALSSALGDWRAVAFAWGAISLASMVPVLAVSLDPEAAPTDGAPGASVAMTRAAALAIGGYAFVYASFNGAYIGVSGLMPYQLREWDWPASLADVTLALTTIGFIVGSALLGTFTDRFGRRVLSFAVCLIGAGLVSGLCVWLARDGVHPVVVGGNAALGVLAGAFVVLFPVMLADPRIPAELAPEAIGWATTASSAGGFMIPFLFAPYAENHPEWVLGAYAVGFAISGGAMALFAREPGEPESRASPQ